MLAIIEKVEFDCPFNQSRPPLDFEKEIEVRFEEMDYAESRNLWVASALRFHNVDRIAPSRDYEAPLEKYLHKVGQALQECGVLNDGFIVSKVSSRGRC